VSGPHVEGSQFPAAPSYQVPEGELDPDARTVLRGLGINPGEGSSHWSASGVYRDSNGHEWMVVLNDFNLMYRHHHPTEKE
jgi:hypothetical protein